MMLSEEHVVTKKLEEWAKKKGDKPFFYYGENQISLTYKEFNNLTNRIAHSFQQLGIQKGDRISVFMRNAYISTLAMFGAWKAGGIYAPINFNYTGKTLSYLINDTNPKILLIERELLPVFDQIKDDLSNKDLKIVIYDPVEGDHDYNPNSNKNFRENELSFEQLKTGSESNLDVDLNFSDSANIIYTSGTTGLPKGVLQAHRWMYGYALFFGKMLNEEDVIYNDLPLYHVGGAFYNITRAVYAGCSVAVWDKFSSSQFWERIRISQSTSAVLVGVMTPWLLNAEPTPNDRCNTLNKVHIQPLPSYHHEMAKRFGFDFILAGFGQTETGFGICGLIKELDEMEGTPSEYYRGYSRDEIVQIAQELNIDILDGKAEIPKGYMGKAADFLEATILNEFDEECKPGEFGELAIRPQIPNIILTEYFNKQEAALKAFSNLWFHTGDSAYIDENGVFYFVDRQSSILKVRGEKFSSYHMEDLLFEHSSIGTCAVVPIPATYGDEIAAFVVVKEGKSLNETELRQWIENNMPKYMWPKYIRFVDEIPKTLTNKVQKFKLKESLLKELGQVPN